MIRNPVLSWLLPALLLAALPAGAAGDPAKGEKLYVRCQGCHSVDTNRVGPRHQGLFGRAAGSLEDYNYSDAMKASGVVWDETTLDKFLTAPREYINGTKMPFAGMKDPQERADLIAWLKQATAIP
ncbi:MAG TPA: cytochrome c family protein [Dongiaceae bacterium]